MHGGDIYRNRVKMDFSVNINPLGMSDEVRDALIRGLILSCNYPDPLCGKLRDKLAAHFGLGMENILCGNGASELLMAICRWKKPGHALLLAPCFSGYEKALQAVGCKPDYFLLRAGEDFALTQGRFEDLLHQILKRKPDFLFLANPSNPVGTLLSKEQLRELAACCGKAGTVLVLDECFMELCAEPSAHSMTGHVMEYPNLIILRAFTKSFAIPGIRLGYLLCGDGALVDSIAAELPEWNVSVMAQLAGVTALDGQAYLQKSREFIIRERNFLAEGLGRLGAKVYPSAANFLLFEWKDDSLYEKLLQKEILIRDCRDYEGLKPGYFRIAVKNHEENAEFLQVMTE